METPEEIQDRIDEILAESEDEEVLEILILGTLSERIAIFQKLRDLIQEKELENDEIASRVLGWAYEKIAND
jgi:hypothetical protein